MLTFQGLFKRAILQSGAWTYPSWAAIDKKQANILRDFAAETLNCPKESNYTDCFKEADTDTLLKLQKADFFSPVTAVVDGELLTKNPYDFLAENGVINVEEIIIGSTLDEGLLTTGELLINPSSYNEWFGGWNWAVAGPLLLFGKRYKDDTVTDITELDIDRAYKVLEYYTGKTENINSEDFDNITNMFTDSFWYAGYKFAELLTEQGVTVYEYQFSYKGTKASYKIMAGNSSYNNSSFRRVWLPELFWS